MLATRRPRPAWIARRRHALRAMDTVVAEVGAKTRKIRLKRVEKRKRLRSVDKVEVASKADRMPVEGPRNVVNQLETRLAVEIGIAAVASRRERVGQLQVRPRGNRGEIER